MAILYRIYGRPDSAWEGSGTAEYGWFSSVFCLTEDFWGEEVMREAEKTDPEEAYRKLEAQIRKLNPQAKPDRMRKFILG